MSTRELAQLVTGVNPTPGQGNEANRNAPAAIVVKHEPDDRTHVVPVQLWDSDPEGAGNTLITRTRPKRARNASAGPSKRTRTSTDAPKASATLTIGPATATPSVSAGSTTPAATAREVELKAELERVKVERDCALEERDALLELYRNSVRRTRGE